MKVSVKSNYFKKINTYVVTNFQDNYECRSVSNLDHFN